VPKSYTLQHAERVALAVAGPITAFHTLFRPFIWVLVAASNVVLRWLGLPPEARRAAVHSEEELKMLVNASREQGVLEEDEQAMLHKVFAFADKDAQDVMVPRPDVVALPLDMPVSELLRLMLQHPYTRYPVFEGDLDDIVGVLHVRDLFAALHDRGIDNVDVRSLLRSAIVVPETKRLDELLAEFRATSNHMAIVVDEYGSVAGLATLEDLLEEIVGEIGDEFDLPDAGIRRLGKGRVRLGGSFPIEEFNERFGTSLPDEDYHSVGGFVFGELGRAPKVGDSVTANGTRFEVSGVDGPRIVEVDVTLAATEQQPGEQQSAQGGV
jgi:magnesium and cobalt exporter, CNNM family